MDPKVLLDRRLANTTVQRGGVRRRGWSSWVPRRCRREPRLGWGPNPRRSNPWARRALPPSAAAACTPEAQRASPWSRVRVSGDSAGTRNGISMRCQHDTTTAPGPRIPRTAWATRGLRGRLEALRPTFLERADVVMEAGAVRELCSTLRAATLDALLLRGQIPTHRLSHAMHHHCKTSAGRKGASTVPLATTASVIASRALL